MLTRLYNWLFKACVHKWETIKEGRWEDTYGQFGQMFILRCTLCGEIKSKRV